MELQTLKRGLVVQHENQNVEYLRSTSDSDALVKCVDTGVIKTVRIGNLNAIPTQQYYEDRKLVESWVSGEGNEKLDVVREKTRRRFLVISRVMATAAPKDRKIHALMQALKLSRAQVFRLLRDYRPEIGPVSIEPHARGPKAGSKKLSPEVEEVLQSTIDQCLKKDKEKFTYSHAWRMIRFTCSECGLPPPSLEVVRRRCKEKGQKAVDKRIYGPEYASNKYRPKMEGLRVTAPLKRVEIDHTLVDIILVDDELRRPIGRPWVTLQIDTCTRAILGFYLSLNAPSRYSVACCVQHAILPKEKWMSFIGVENVSYPFYGKPTEILVDNAREFHSADFKSACDVYGIKLEWRKEKHYGGRVERLIGTMMTSHIHFLPGTTMSNPGDRGSYDSDKFSALTFLEFREVFLREVAIYHESEHRGLGMTPMEAWRKHFRNEKNEITHPPIMTDPHRLKLDFMPSTTRAVNSYGIDFESIRYQSYKIRHLIGSRVKFRYCPESLLTIYVEDRGKYVGVQFDDLRWPDINLEELKLAKKKARKSGAKVTSQEIFAQVKCNREIISKAVANTRSARRLNVKINLREEHAIQQTGVVSIQDPEHLDGVDDIGACEATPKTFNIEFEG